MRVVLGLRGTCSQVGLGIGLVTGMQERVEVDLPRRVAETACIGKEDEEVGAGRAVCRSHEVIQQ